MFLLRNSLHKRIFVALAFVALFSTAGLGLVAYLTQRHALERQFSAELEAAVEFKAQEITTWLAERKSDVEFLADSSLNRQQLAAIVDPTTRPADRRQLTTLLTATLAGMQRLRSDYYRLLIADPSGNVLISPLATLVGKPVSNVTALQATLQQDGLYIEDIIFDPESGKYAMCFGHLLRSPTTGANGTVLGVLLITVDMEKSIYPLLNQWRMGETGAVVLSRAEVGGTRLLNQVRNAKAAPLEQLLPMVVRAHAKPAQLAANREQGTQLAIDHLNASVLTVYRYLPELRGGLVFKMDTAEIYAPLHQLVLNVVIIAIAVLLLSMLISVFIAQSLTQPLRRLVFATRAVAQGNLAVSVDVQRDDEIGKLAGAFSEMVTVLDRHQYQLKAANQVARSILSARPLEEVLFEIVQAAQRLTGAGDVALFINNDAGGAIIATPQSCARFAALRPSTLSRDVLSLNPAAYQSADGLKSSCYCNLECSIGDFLAATNEIIKIAIYGREQQIGLWLIEQPSARAFTETDHNAFTALATYVAVALENAQLLQNWQRWHGELEVQVTARTHELAQANARLHELDEMKSEFIYNVSHELRNPISNLKLQLDLLRNNAASPRRDKYIAAIGKQVDIMALLIKDMLDLIQLDKMGGQLELHPLDLRRLLAEAVARYHALLPDQRVRLLWETIGPPLMVNGAPLQLERAFDHLLRNAINFTPVGEVRVNAHCVDDKICVEIIDTGIGIAAVDLPHIFQRFYRGGNVSQSTIPGSGLGLSLVQEVARLHHGQLAVESQLNQGTTLRFWLPHYQQMSTPMKIYG